MITLVITAVFGAVLLAVLVLLALTFRRPRSQEAPEAVGAPVTLSKTCPLCGSLLGPGQRVHSVVYATKTQDKIMEISGCPSCRPPATQARLCPVCKKELRPQDVVTARVFERPQAEGAKKTHVHVLGCPRCRS